MSASRPKLVASSAWYASCLGLALALLALPAKASAADPIVILLSWDGVRHDYIDRVELPALARMQRDGARAERLVPIFPTLTFPNHVALATGAPADRHGIVANSFRTRDGQRFDFDNDATWIEAEPLWVAAERQGVRTAVFFWVGSESDWRGVGATYRRTPFDKSIGEPEKVAQLLAWLDLPPERRPRLLMAWWHGADAVGHRDGPASAGIADALREQDAALGALMAGLDARRAWSDVTLIVLSDHGMAAVSEPVDLATKLGAEGIEAEVLSGEGVASIWLVRPELRPSALAVLANSAGIRAFAADAVPEGLRYRLPERTGDVIAIATPPRFFITPRSGDIFERVRLALGWERGAHGFDPANPEMAGVFLAIGRGVAAGVRLPPVRAIDVAPTVARLLAIAPPHNAEGRPIPGVGDSSGARVD